MGEGGFWAVLTAPILESDVSDGAKLFYAQLSRFTGKDGICWASHRALSIALQVGERTISRYVSELETGGFICTEFVGISDRKRHAERHIRLANPFPFSLTKNGEANVAKNGEANIAKNGEVLDRDNNINNSMLGINNPPEPPTGGPRVPEAAKWMPERFEAFWKFYRKNVNSANRAAARKAWAKLKPDDDTLRRIGAALQRRLRADDEWRRGIGRPHASTYLNGMMWLDEPVTASKPEPQREAVEQREAFGVWH